MLEFPDEKEIAHLLGVFMRDQFFFRSIGIRFNTSETGKGCYIQFYLLGDMQKGLQRRDTQTAMRSLLCYYTFAELPMRSVR